MVKNYTTSKYDMLIGVAKLEDKTGRVMFIELSLQGKEITVVMDGEEKKCYQPIYRVRYIEDIHTTTLIESINGTMYLELRNPQGNDSMRAVMKYYIANYLPAEDEWQVMHIAKTGTCGALHNRFNRFRDYWGLKRNGWNTRL